jgi:hypothetical protein
VPCAAMSRIAANTWLARVFLLAWRTPSRLERIPPPAAAICSYEAPSMRFSKSTSRGLTNTGCVCESTKPGRTTLPEQSISVILFRFFFSQGSRRASFVVPMETIFPAEQRTAPFSMMRRSLRAGPRRGLSAPEERSVINWLTLTSNKIGGVFLRSKFKQTVV